MRNKLTRERSRGHPNYPDQHHPEDGSCHIRLLWHKRPLIRKRSVEARVPPVKLFVDHELLVINVDKPLPFKGKI